MAILKVSRMGHPVLRAKARAVDPAEITTPVFQKLIDDMFQTMREYQGIGLAAPQVHEGLRLFVAGLRPSKSLSTLSDDDDMPYVALINPQISPATDEVEMDWEGCLSIPDIRGLVPRARKITVTAWNRDGKKIELAASGLPARVIQHETDHLDGVLFFDRMRTFVSLTYLDEYQKYWRRDDDEGDE